jgi:hypothetical protein
VLGQSRGVHAQPSGCLELNPQKSTLQGSPIQ